MKDLDIGNLNRRIADSCQILEEILKEIEEQKAQLNDVKSSREEALVRVDESNEASQKILEESYPGPYR